ncbi:MAG TPA: metallophosphoesterase, partial [Clostridiales bacterium]|nr:metallophosphoesterase [Clostridiales bacterium]
DLGMTGPAISVLGVKPEQSIALFRGELKSRYEPAGGPCRLCGAVFTIDAKTRRCTGVERVMVD